MSTNATDVKEHWEQFNAGSIEDSADSKRNAEESQQLLKDIPGIEDLLPAELDLNIHIDAPLVTKDGRDFNDRQSALIAACNVWLFPELVELLLKHGANPNAVCNSGYARNTTALMLAIRTMPRRTIEALLEHGADVLLKDSNGNTVIDWMAHDIQPGSVQDPNFHQMFSLGFLEPEFGDYFSRSDKMLPLLTAIRNRMDGTQLQATMKECGINFPHDVCSIIDQYIIEISNFSQALSREPRHVQSRFFGMLKRASEIYSKGKKLAKLASLSDSELDSLIAATRSLSRTGHTAENQITLGYTTAVNHNAPTALTYQYAASQSSTTTTAVLPTATTTASAAASAPVNLVATNSSDTVEAIRAQMSLG